ncbi:MAG: insulinase family protein [Clostridia bacterium]|nr:insulinase family protein [Clostridia bacterium]
MHFENIADGVRLCAQSTDKFKTCRINVSMAMPLDTNASARAILPFILQRRCAKYPDFTTLNRVLDELYGASVSAGVIRRGEAQILSFNLTAIDDRFALDGDTVALECVQLLCDMIFDPLTDGDSFPADIVEQEKRLLIEAIENEMNDKRRYALMRCEEIMFDEEAYGINRLGTVADVKDLTPDDIYYAWKEELREAQIQITMVGSMDVEPVANMLKERFSSIKRQPTEITTKFISAIPKPDYVCEEMPIKQGKLVMGFRTGMRNEDDNPVPMRIAVDIFGGGTYSKLFSVVREKMSLCYYCSAAFFSSKGVVMVQSGIEDVNEEKAKSEIVNQLSLVADGQFTDDDFSSSIKSLTDSIISNNDTPESICAWYATQLLRDTLKTPEAYVEEIKNVDKQQVISAAKTIKLDTVFMLKSNGEVADDED